MTADSLTFLSLNIEGSKHLDQVETLLKSRKPDIVTLQEVHEQDMARLALAGGYAYRYEPMSSYTNKETGEAMRKGMMLMWNRSFTLTQLVVQVYVSTENAEDSSVLVRAANERNRTLFTIELTKAGKSYRFATTHFVWTQDGSVDAAQEEAMTKLLALLERYNDSIGVVLSGDFNAPRGLATWDRLAAVLKDNIPTNVTTTIDQHLHRAKGLIYVVDGLFSTPNYLASDVEVVDAVSDHKAILAKISIK